MVGAEGQQRCFVSADVLDKAVLQEVRVEVFQAWRDGKIFRRKNRARVEVENGIDVEPGRVLEELAQAAQKAAFVVVVKTLVEYLREVGRAHSQADGPLGVARQIGCKAVIAAEVGDKHRLVQCAERVGAVKKVI